MASRWETFPIQLTGGLTTNLSRLQHGLQAPGAPRILRNFEPSLRGGYRRVNGYTKYIEDVVPNYFGTLVQGSGQTGTTLEVANLPISPIVGDTFSVTGVTGTYEISNVVFDANENSAVLTLTTALASSPDDKASVTFDNNTNLIQGLWVGGLNDQLKILVARDGVVFQQTSGWSKANSPSYGTVLVNGALQTGTTLNVDGLDDDVSFASGDTFSIVGVELVYTVQSVAAGATANSQVLTISPALDSSPADDAVVNLLSTRLSGDNKYRFNKFNFSGTEKVAVVDGVNYPNAFNGSNFEVIDGTTDVLGANHVVEFKGHLFLGNEDLAIFTAPFEQNNFNTGDGAGTFRLPDTITGMVVFREQLIIFTSSSIHRVSGSSSLDFQLSVISNKLGCVEPDTIEEVGGDIMYMGPDGIRFLGATERIGDFSLALASATIQSKIEELENTWTSFNSVTLRSKNQYRIFGYRTGIDQQNSAGYLATQYMDQNVNSLQWAELKGIPVYTSHSTYFDNKDYAIFANEDGYVYWMDQGNSFDGATIEAKLATPFMSINDPMFRKTIYKIHTFYDPEGIVEGNIGLTFDFDDPNKIQPPNQDFEGGGSFSFYGTATYGVNTYGGKPDTVNTMQTVGAGFQVSINYEFTNTTAPFILDTVILEYATEGRK